MSDYREQLTKYKDSKRTNAPNKPLQKKRKKEVNKPWKVICNWNFLGTHEKFVFGRYKTKEIAEEVIRKKTLDRSYNGRVVFSISIERD